MRRRRISAIRFCRAIRRARWRRTARRRSRNSVSSTTKTRIARLRRLKIVPSEKPAPPSDSELGGAAPRRRRLDDAAVVSFGAATFGFVVGGVVRGGRRLGGRDVAAGGRGRPRRARAGSPSNAWRRLSAVTTRTGGSVSPVPGRVRRGVAKPWSSRKPDQPVSSQVAEHDRDHRAAVAASRT